jgi:MFS family permease
MDEKAGPEEKYIANENPEVRAVEDLRWIHYIANAFPAFGSRNYRIYFSGQLVSLIGTWLQVVAQGWLVLQLTNSVFQVGLITALSSLPSLFFALPGGVIVDRFSKRKILFCTQAAAMLLAFILGLLSIFNLIVVWEIGIIAFLLGTVNAIDAPARQAFVSELVDKDQLPSAIALNSAIFNTARVIGPSVAGLLIALIGTGGAFIINGCSYVAVLAALLSLRMPEAPPKQKIDTFTAVKEGLYYSFTHPVIRTLIVFTGVSSVFGWSYTTVMPVIAQHKFHLGAAGLGYLYAASGLGSLLATFLIAAFSKKVSPLLFIFGGNALFAISIVLFSYTSDLHFALPLLFCSGLGLLSQFAMMNTMIQRIVKNEFRGRVMSIYILMFVGMIPLGNFEVGLLAEKTDTDFAIRTGAIIVFLFGAILFGYRNKIRASYKNYKEANQI